MPDHAKGKLRKSWDKEQQRHSRLEEAAKDYLSQPKPRALGFRKIAEKYNVDKDAVRRKAKGMNDLWETWKGGSKVSQEGEAKLVEYIEGCADRAHPLSRRDVIDKAEVVLRAEQEAAGAAELEETKSGRLVTRNWYDRFKARNSDRIQTSWASSQTISRCQALNHTIAERHFSAVGARYIKEGARDKDVWAVDETFLSEFISLVERVVCRVGTKRAQAEQSGGREITSIMPAICADGSSLPPLVIFKGLSIQPSWVQDNPGKFPVACTPHGYMTGVLLRQWIEWFDEQTAAQSSGRKRFLHMDNHSSHLDPGFIDYAREHGIIVIGYPPNMTHIMQGLDRIHFGRLKSLWPQQIRKFEAENGSSVGKQHLLAVLDGVWPSVFTEHNNREAFVVTGLSRPVEPWRITDTMIAPSEQSSTTSSFPIPQSAAVEQLTSIFGVISELQSAPSNPTTPVKNRLSDDARYTLELTPRTMSINPEHLSPRTQKRAIARHIYLAQIDLPTRRDTIESTSAPFEPVLGSTSLSDPIVLTSSDQPIDPALVHTPTAEMTSEAHIAMLQGACCSLQNSLEASQAVNGSQTSIIRGQNAQMVIQSEDFKGLQAKLNTKEKRRKETHTTRALRDSGGRFFTDDAVRDAMSKDNAETETKELKTVRTVALRVARAQTKAHHDRANDRMRKAKAKIAQAYDSRLRDNKRRGITKKPRRSPPPAKSPTPERLREAEQRVERLTVTELRELKARKDAGGKGQVLKQRAVARGLRALDSLLFDDAPSAPEADDDVSGEELDSGDEADSMDELE